MIWSPDSQRFAFTYSPSHLAHTSYVTTTFYQLRDGKWLALRPPADRESERSQMVQLARDHLSKGIGPGTWNSSPTRDILRARGRADASDIILYAYATGFGHRSKAEAVFLVTLKFDPQGNWKIVKTERTTER